MNASHPTASQQRHLPAWQERATRRLSFGALGLGLAIMIVGALVDWWIPTPGRTAFGTVFGLMLLMVTGARHAYLRGVADATAHFHADTHGGAKA